MSFLRINELLRLQEGPIEDFMGGYDRAKGAVEKAKGKAKESRVTISKAQTEVVKKMSTDFLNQFFDQFPNFGSSIGPEEIQKNITTRAQAKAVFNIFKKLAADLDGMLTAMNNALSASKKIDKATLTRCINTGKQKAETEPQPDLVNFVKKEASFFKRLIKLDDDFNLNKRDFTELLRLKMNATGQRYPDAVCALNIILAYMVKEIEAYAKQIGIVGEKMPSETNV